MSETTQEFDLSAFEAAETAVVEIEDAKGEPLLYKGQQVTIEVYGPGSAQYQRAQSKIDAAGQTRAMQMVRGKTPKDAADENRKLAAEKLAACTKAVNNFPIPGGALALYSNPKLGYITAQVGKFIEDWSNFQPASTTN